MAISAILPDDRQTVPAKPCANHPGRERGVYRRQGEETELPRKQQKTRASPASEASQPACRLAGRNSSRTWDSPASIGQPKKSPLTRRSGCGRPLTRHRQPRWKLSDTTSSRGKEHRTWMCIQPGRWANRVASPSGAPRSGRQGQVVFAQGGPRHVDPAEILGGLLAGHRPADQADPRQGIGHLQPLGIPRNQAGNG